MATTIALGALLAAEEALKRLGTQQVRAQTAYRLAKLTEAVTAETKHYHAQRHDLIKSLGAERPATPEEHAAGLGSTVFEVTAENRAAFMARLEDLLGLEITIDRWLLTVADLDAFTMSGDDARAIAPLVTEPPDRTP